MDDECIKIILISILLAFLIYMGYTFSDNASGNNETIENYDGKISNMTLTQCGTECTISENCRAFAYKPISATCYLSERGLLGEPVESLFAGDYSKLDKRCNKINPINDIDFISDTTLTQNSVYVCSDGENNESTEFQYANLGSSSLETSEQVGATFGRGVPTKVANRPEHATPLAVNYDVYKINYPDKELIQDAELRSGSRIHVPDLVPNFPKLVNKTDAEIEADQKTGGYSDRKRVLIDPDSAEVPTAFIESDMEFLGQYLLAHQCVVNVPFYDCIKFCDSDEKCAGTEWNKSIVRSDGKNNLVYENVCCPKQIITKIIPRRNQFSRGKFYVKSDLNKIRGRDSILLTRQNIDKPNGIEDLEPTIDGSNRFALRMTDRTSPDIYHHSDQNLNVEPVTNFVLPGDNDKINYS